MGNQSVGFQFQGLSLEADIHSWPASKGARESMGQPIEPDDPGGFDVEAVRVIANEDELTEEEVAAVLADSEGIAQAIIDELEGQEPDYD